VVKDNVLFCHVPRALSSIKQGTGSIGHFLTKKGSKGQVQVVGKAINHMGEDMGSRSHAFSSLLDS